MTIQIPVRMPTFMRVELTVDGRPELDRAIELPQRSPRGWIAEAYRLSVGLDPQENADDDGIDRCHHDEAYAYPWPAEPRVEEIPGLPHDPMIVVRTIDTPPIGTPWISVSSLTSVSSASSEVHPSAPPIPGSSVGWLTGLAPFCEDDVNRELLRRHGVVQPHFDDSDLWFVDPRLPVPSPIATLASVVTPARRLALLAHIDANELLHSTAPDFGDAESAVAALARLLDRLGAEGIAQDADTGWIPESDTDRIVRSLGWDGTLGETRARGAALLAFARRARLIRRLKGRVVATALSRKLCDPSPQTLGTLASLIAAPADDWRDFRSSRSKAEEAVALLAIADGSALHLDDLAGLVIEGARAFAESDARVVLDDAVTPWGGMTGGDAVSDVRQLGERMGLLSAPNAHGMITPAMREVARFALVSRSSSDRYAY